MNLDHNVMGNYCYGKIHVISKLHIFNPVYYIYIFNLKYVFFFFGMENYINIK